MARVAREKCALIDEEMLMADGATTPHGQCLTEALEDENKSPALKKALQRIKNRSDSYLAASHYTHHSSHSTEHSSSW